MFFLKELPTHAMVKRYSNEFSPNKSHEISKKLQGLREYSLLIRALDDYFSSYELSQLRFLILMVIDRELQRDWLYASEITERLDVSKPVLSRAIKNLLTEQLLNKEKDTQDARASKLSITTQGKALLTEILPGYFKILTDAKITR
ncbi:MarR family winged helix-turn-helix transcriptional regulator [Paraglaciecola sp. 2405UD69-4]|uniref:MarR family winged helix-turn-helix transcriptional regulator n=1 Tax=Paraglaciecola sp. 2405UD69-4 TaxID=3391836 RepID=UPI0039C93728